ncbi:MerR family transcriptional regulator, partial [Isoptericola sp. NPDC057191]|uniref:MerR family transcriptional regulator n=1 Tax=Isoptericola sp. NPDC057191 TaxID=3346041 RepID=UPI003641F249
MTSSRPVPHGGGSRASSPGLAVAAVARRLGVAPATLRTWDRRYGLGPSARTAGSHRRYTPEDVARLLVMRRLTLEGVAPVDAAKAALEAGAEELEEATEDAAPAAPGEPDDDAQEAADGRPAAPGGDDAPRPGRAHLRALPGGGEGTSGASSHVPGASASGRVSAVVDAALAYDQQTCDEILAIPAQGDPAAWWTEIAEPAWQRVAQRTV